MATAPAETELQTSGWRPSFWIYVLAPFVVIAGAVLALWQLPTIAFAGLTVRRAVNIESHFLTIFYAVALALICVASFAWPFVVLYVVSQV